MNTWQPGGWLDGARWLPSPNFGERPAGSDVSLVVIHNISLPPDEFGGDWVEDFFLNRLDPAAHPYFATIHTFEVSSHFLICRDGQLIQYVSTEDRAWHAGVSNWRGQARCNDFSIGIELEGCDDKPFTHKQYTVLAQLTQTLRKRHPNINSVAGHSEIAPQRKTDPGACFEWARYEQQAGIENKMRKTHTQRK